MNENLHFYLVVVDLAWICHIWEQKRTQYSTWLKPNWSTHCYVWQSESKSCSSCISMHDILYTSWTLRGRQYYLVWHLGLFFTWPLIWSFPQASKLLCMQRIEQKRPLFLCLREKIQVVENQNTRIPITGNICRRLIQYILLSVHSLNVFQNWVWLHFQ